MSDLVELYTNQFKGKSNSGCSQKTEEKEKCLNASEDPQKTKNKKQKTRCEKKARS